MADLQSPAGGAGAVEVSASLNYRHRREKVMEKLVNMG